MIRVMSGDEQAACGILHPPLAWLTIVATRCFVARIVAKMVVSRMAFVGVVLIVATAQAFRPAQRDLRRSTSIFVRNIDLPECLLFYGRASLDGGIESLVDECRDTETAVVLIDDGAGPHDPTLPENVRVVPTTISPPNPHDLIRTIEGMTIQPLPFGGSAGFGQKLPDPPRAPLPARCVVLGTSEDHSRAARAAGMRVLSLEDNPLADAVVDSFEDLWLEDIATPGSFWLNPPHPRDDDGNKVDVDKLIQLHHGTTNSSINDGTEDDELARILADMAPLK